MWKKNHPQKQNLKPNQEEIKQESENLQTITGSNIIPRDLQLTDVYSLFPQLDGLSTQSSILRKDFSSQKRFEPFSQDKKEQVWEELVSLIFRVKEIIDYFPDLKTRTIPSSSTNSDTIIKKMKNLSIDEIEQNILNEERRERKEEEKEEKQKQPFSSFFQGGLDYLKSNPISNLTAQKTMGGLQRMLEEKDLVECTHLFSEDRKNLDDKTKSKTSQKKKDKDKNKGKEFKMPTQVQEILQHP